MDKEIRAKATGSPQAWHRASSKKIPRGSLLQGYESLGSRSQDRDRLEASCYIVKPLSDDVEFECSSSEMAEIPFSEMELLKALPTDSLRLEIHHKKDLIAYALSLKKGSIVKVQHGKDAVSAVVQHIGPLSGTDKGTIFGVELIVS